MWQSPRTIKAVRCFYRDMIMANASHATLWRAAERQYTTIRRLRSGATDMQSHTVEGEKQRLRDAQVM